jgi:hypothetical protein
MEIKMEVAVVDWSKSHNGVMLCSFERTKELMPEVAPMLDELLESYMLEEPQENYLVDVKIHMLIPGMYPCIPDWHTDFQPRDEDLKRTKTVECSRKMYMWLSGPPATEYLDSEGNIYKKKAGQWNTFTRNDVHRGTKATEHTWRCFIRVIPKDFVHKGTKNTNQIRRHTQVYLPENYNW